MTDSSSELEDIPEVEASVWRLGPGGRLLSSVVEKHAARFAEGNPESIYFYADLKGSDQVTHDEETMQKVHEALVNVGLSDGQIINAINEMQNAGILFRERAH